MLIDVKMPDLAATEGSDISVKRWLIAVGAPVKRGQPLLEVETDKATMEVEFDCYGRPRRESRARPNEEVAVGQIIATIEVEP